MKTRVILPVILCLAALSEAQAAVMLIDFGDGNGVTTGNYNNVITTDGTTIPLIDDSGSLTGFELANSDGALAGGGANYAGSFPASVASQPASALQDSLFIRSDTIAEFATITISGLSSLETYDLLIYGARGNNGLEAIFTAVDASGSSAGSISNVFNNAAETVSFDGLVPDGSGEIILQFASEVSGSSGAALNFMSITSNPVPEPGAATFLGFSAMMILGRRTRS